MKYYKVLGKGGISCNGGTGHWLLPLGNKPGLWMDKIDPIIPCQRGYHLCRKEDLIYWINEEIYEAEGRGKYKRHDNNKDVFPEARLIRKLDNWNNRTIRLFAADCAEHVLHIFEEENPKDDRPRIVIQASRDFANGKISDVAMSAAMVAAGAAAWAATGSLARAAVWDVSWIAVWAGSVWAGEVATGNGEECKWQTKRLFCYLQGQLT